MKHYVILTRFSYSEPGHSSSRIVPFEADCEPDELPRLYRAWMKTKVEDEGVNERHYGHKKVISAYEAVSIPTHPLDAAIKGAYADLDAAEQAATKEAAEQLRAAAAAHATGADAREREEYVRLSAKFGVDVR